MEVRPRPLRALVSDGPALPFCRSLSADQSLPCTESCKGAHNYCIELLFLAEPRKQECKWARCAQACTKDYLGPAAAAWRRLWRLGFCSLPVLLCLVAVLGSRHGCVGAARRRCSGCCCRHCRRRGRVAAACCNGLDGRRRRCRRRCCSTTGCPGWSINLHRRCL